MSENADSILGGFVDGQDDDKNQLEMLGSMMKQQLQIEGQIKNLDTQLKDAKKNLRALQEDRLPTFIERYGLEGITYDGKKLTIKKDVSASITKDNQADAFAYLEDNGFEDLIKSEIKIGFGAAEGDDFAECVNSLQESGVAHTTRHSVHPQTLKAFVKRQLEVQQDFPRKLFSVYEIKKAIIK